LDDEIVPEYLLYAMTARKEIESFTRSFRASLANMRRFVVSIPVLPGGRFDIAAQKRLAAQFFRIREQGAEVARIKADLDLACRDYLSVP
jgi:hypothetical protein